MSNFLAIATVTAALGNALQAAVGADVPGATVTTQRPEDSTNGAHATGLNIFLYQVMPNGALRNADLPTRRPDGQPVQRPQAAIDLHYLLSFYGNDTQLEPQRLLGSVVRQLHSRPLLTRRMIQDTITSPTYSFLAASNLADALEVVRFTPLSLSLEELSKLWSVLFQTPYALSVAYQASVLLIEEEIAPMTALPVRQRRVFTVPFSRALIEAVTPQFATPGATLTVQGHNLMGEVTTVKVGAVVVNPDTLSDSRVTITLPGTLLAGVTTVQVIHAFDFGTPTEPHRGFESNVGVFILTPAITTVAPINATRGAVLSLSFAPPVGRTQAVALVVGDQTITIPSRPSTDPPTATTVGFPIPADFPTGTFLLRVRVDNADSPLIVDTNPMSPTFNQYIGPTVTVA